jgi:hypothetical protein
MTPETDRFHAHLDKCYQCREYPFDLCPIGARLLRESTDRCGGLTSLMETLGYRRPKPETQRKE